MEEDQGDAESDAEVVAMTDFLRPNREGYEEEDLADQAWDVEPCSDVDVLFEACGEVSC